MQSVAVKAKDWDVDFPSMCTLFIYMSPVTDFKISKTWFLSFPHPQGHGDNLYALQRSAQHGGRDLWSWPACLDVDNRRQSFRAVIFFTLFG